MGDDDFDFFVEDLADLVLQRNGLVLETVDVLLLARQQLGVLPQLRVKVDQVDSSQVVAHKLAPLLAGGERLFDDQRALLFVVVHLFDDLDQLCEEGGVCDLEVLAFVDVRDEERQDRNVLLYDVKLVREGVGNYLPVVVLYDDPFHKSQAAH